MSRPSDRTLRSLQLKDMPQMPEQTEKLIRFFNEKGYQPILFARTDLTPPDVYDFRDGAFERLGPLVSFLKSGAAIPKPTLAKSTDFERVDTSAYAGKVSFSFFKNLLELFGLGSAEARSEIAADTDSTYRFNNVAIASVSVIDIERALSLLDDRFKAEAKSGSMHVAYEYIYAGKVQMSRGGHNDTEVDLSADLPQVTKVSATASKVRTDSSSSDYKSSTQPVVIAFKVGQLVRSGTDWKLRVRRSNTGLDPISADRRPYVYRPGEILIVQQHGDLGEEEKKSLR
jgi:hypothetical protein